MISVGASHPTVCMASFLDSVNQSSLVVHIFLHEKFLVYLSQIQIKLVEVVYVAGKFKNAGLN